MYESFYGLKEKPFTLLPDPEYLYLSPKHQRALTLLEYGMMNQAGFSVICGDTGAGKTTLIRRLLAELEENTTVGLITNTHQSFGELLNWVLMAFGLDGEGKSKSQMHHIFIEFLIEQYAQNKHTVLIVDEAQNMKADTLEELRMLSNINADKDQVLQVILAGQPALRETLRQPELMQFAQRIAVDYYLEALSEEETRGYIQHRLQIAGADQQIFTDDACKAIYKYSGGTPRLINLLCDTSLVYGFAEQTKTIDAGLVHDVVREQHSNSIIPTFNTSQPHKTDNLPPVRAESAITESDPSAPPVASPGEVGSVPPVVQAVAETTAANTSNERVAETAPSQKQDKETDVIAGLAERAAKAMNQLKPEAEVEVSSAKQGAVSAQESQLANTESAGTTAEDVSHDVDEQEDEVESARKYEEEVAPYRTQRHYRDDSHREEVYPIVHIEDNPKKGINMMLIGLVIGMFIASIMMMVFAWMMLDDKNRDSSRVEQVAPASSTDTQLETLKKERDAALTVTRALERERDAAVNAAKAQEQMRAAELRAAEILAEQERKTDARLNEARARAREAEIAEAKARERERAIQIRAQQRAAEFEAQLEAKRIEALRAERKQQLLAQQAASLRAAQEAAKTEVPVVSAPQEEVRKIPAAQAETKPAAADADKSFSANPCNSPSAKFLSTCKR